MNRKNRLILFTVLALLAVALDQYTKMLAFAHLRGNGGYPLIPEILELVYAENRGAAFGILQGKTWLFFLMAALVCSLIVRAVYIMPQKKRMLPFLCAFTLIFSGALGNIIDRMSRGFVVDFIYFKPIDFPIFNIADIYVSCSAAFVVYLLLFYYKEEEVAFLSFERDGEKKR